jgi:hypothetical protein
MAEPPLDLHSRFHGWGSSAPAPAQKNDAAGRIRAGLPLSRGRTYQPPPAGLGAAGAAAPPAGAAGPASCVWQP